MSTEDYSIIAKVMNIPIDSIIAKVMNIPIDSINDQSFPESILRSLSTLCREICN